MQAGFASMKPSEEVQRVRRQFAVGHAIFLFVVFLPLFVLALAIGVSEDVSYFVGNLLVLLLLPVPVALVLPALHTVVRPTSRFLLVSVGVPAATLAVTGLVWRVRIDAAVTALGSPECFALPAKHQLHLAYAAADELYGICQTLMRDASGDPQQVLSIWDCVHYEEASKEWGRQFGYLESLERRFPCAGICYGGRRLWHDADTLAPPCGAFAAQWLRSAGTLAAVIVGCSIFLLLLLIPGEAVLLRLLVKRHDNVLASSGFGR